MHNRGAVEVREEEGERVRRGGQSGGAQEKDDIKKSIMSLSPYLTVLEKSLTKNVPIPDCLDLISYFNCGNLVNFVTPKLCSNYSLYL
jgi:hypothetical protein